MICKQLIYYKIYYCLLFLNGSKPLWVSTRSLHFLSSFGLPCCWFINSWIFIISPWKKVLKFIREKKNHIPIDLGCFVIRLLEIGPVVLEKFKMWKVYDRQKTDISIRGALIRKLFPHYKKKIGLLFLKKPLVVTQSSIKYVQYCHISLMEEIVFLSVNGHQQKKIINTYWFVLFKNEIKTNNFNQ